MTVFDDIKWIDEELNKEFEGSSDRAAVIVGAVVLDEILKDILSEFFINDKKRVGRLLQGYGAPLSTFSSRIEIAYCLGLIGKKERDNLKIIKDIRNDFAHELTGPTSFTSESVRARCSNIALPNDLFANDLSARVRFQSAVKYLGMLLIIRSFQASKRRCEIQKDLPPVIDFTQALWDATKSDTV